MQLILLVYFGLLIFALPVMVWRWWSNTEQFWGTFKVFYAPGISQPGPQLQRSATMLTCCSH